MWCYTYRRGVRRCSFRLHGQFSGASKREASDSAGLHAFFMPLPILILTPYGCRSPRPQTKCEFDIRMNIMQIAKQTHPFGRNTLRPYNTDCAESNLGRTIAER